MKKYRNVSFFVVALMLFSVCAYAQMFSAQKSGSTQTEKAQNIASKTAKANPNEDSDFDLDKMSPEEEREINKRLQKKYQPRIVNGNLVLNPLNVPDPLDGSKRGTAAFVALPGKDGKLNKKEKSSHIFLYYSNFSMTRSHVAGVGCRMRFNVLTTMDQRLTNLSVKLIWPDISTNISFDNVNPNIETHFDYALFGQGCYNMDKIPNIVVNRCRAKGMSQEECAGKIRWLSKSK